jgi:hypothetical protein
MVVPRIAATPKSDLPRRYFGLLGLACLLSSTIIFLGFAYSTPLVWLLGNAYKQLGPLVGWSILSSSVAYLAGTMFAMNTARRWTFWSTAIISQGVLVTAQILYLCLVGVNSSRSVVMFSLSTSLAMLVGVSTTTALGFSKEVLRSK